MPENDPDPHSAMARSYSNAFEVEMVVGLVQYLVNSNEYNLKDITVLTPYNGQLAAFTRRLNGTCSLWLSEKDRETLLDDGLLEPEDASMNTKTDVEMASVLKLATIDNFQGEESKVVILSLVRSNFDGHVGFLKTPNRINVGCSRARDGFYIVGNASLMRTVDMWGLIIEDWTRKSLIGAAFRACCRRHPTPVYAIQDPQQWYHVPNCQVPCGAKLPCGHVCHLSCHAPALHERISCPEPCPKQHEACRHSCTKTCGEPCGDCAIPISHLTLPCGHQATQSCSGDSKLTNSTCKVPLDPIQLSCGHSVQTTCSTKDRSLECTEKCGQILPCMHRCRGHCHKCTSRKSHPQCNSMCEKELACGHNCTAPCHNGRCPPCPLPCLQSCRHGRCSRKCSQSCDPCIKPCDRSCIHRGSCTLMCCLPCNRFPCNEACPKTLKCGHNCQGLCGEDCSPTCPQCSVDKIPQKAMMMLPCRHTFDVEYLDNIFNIGRIYQINSTGHIQKVGITSIQQLPEQGLMCPECNMSCKDVGRYAIHNQLLTLTDNIDRMYARFCRRLHRLMGQVYHAKVQLDQSLNDYVNLLRPGPLTGRINHSVTLSRRELLSEIESAITGFRGNPSWTCAVIVN